MANVDLTPAQIDRFWASVEISHGCWAWVGILNTGGYGDFRTKKKHTAAHRISFAMENGPIPHGMVIDHICHNTTCVRPSHLRLATPKTNAENRVAPNATNTSGIQGVWRHQGTWRACVRHKGKAHYAGCHSTLAQAEAAVVAKRLELFTYNDADRQEAA